MREDSLRGIVYMKKKIKVDELWFLDSCSENTKERFLNMGNVRSYEKNQCFIRPREGKDDIYFILDGKVQVYNLTNGGLKKILFILGSNDVANQRIFSDIDTVYAETLDNCTFYVIDRNDLRELMQKDFSLTEELMKYQEKKLWRLEHQLKNTSGSIYLEKKLASKLWKLARDFGVSTSKGMLIDMPLSVTFVADLLGASRENTSRSLKKLTDMDLIYVDKKKIYVNMDETSEFYKSAEKK